MYTYALPIVLVGLPNLSMLKKNRLGQGFGVSLNSFLPVTGIASLRALAGGGGLDSVDCESTW